MIELRKKVLPVYSFLGRYIIFVIERFNLFINLHSEQRKIVLKILLQVFAWQGSKHCSR